MPEMMRAILSQRVTFQTYPPGARQHEKKAGVLARAGLRKMHSTRWLVICLGLTACSSVETAALDPGLPPGFLKVKPLLMRVATEYRIVEGLEVAGPIRANAPSSSPPLDHVPPKRRHTSEDLRSVLQR